MQNTKRGFNHSILALILFVLAFITQFFISNFDLDFLNIAVSITALISFLIAIVGGIYLIIGLREESSKEQIIGFIISSVFLMIIVYFIILLCKEV